jgi:hypothetical protein
MNCIEANAEVMTAPVRRAIEITGQQGVAETCDVALYAHGDCLVQGLHIAIVAGRGMRRSAIDRITDPRLPSLLQVAPVSSIFFAHRQDVIAHCARCGFVVSAGNRPDHPVVLPI